MLKGLGATIALPLLDAMTPARAFAADEEASPRRDGDGARRRRQHGLRPAEEPVGARPPPDRHSTSARPRSSPLEPWRDYITIVSNTDVRNAEAFLPPEIGGDHFRSAAVFLTQSHPKQTQGSDLLSGTSLDQLFAQKYGQETPMPSMQLCVENVDQAGGCFYGYSCAYTDSISWATPEEPLPMIRDPRAVFDQLFGIGATPEARAARRRRDKSILDWVTQSTNELKAHARRR